MKAGNGLNSLSFSSCHLFTGSLEEREPQWTEEAVCSALVSTQFLLQIGSWGKGKGVKGRSFSALVGAWNWFGLAGSSKPKPGSVLKPPLRIYCLSLGCRTGCRSIFMSTPLCLFKKTTLLTLFFCHTNNGTKFWMDVFVSGIRELWLKGFFFTSSRCSLTAPCGAA